MITLGTGEHLPPDPCNHPWMVLADESYARNPHLLPGPPQLGQHGPPPYAQANFAANLVQVGHPKVAREENRPTRSSLYAVTITEVTDEDDLVGLGNLTDDLEPDGADTLEPAYIDWLVRVLQTRAKDMRSSKKQDAGKQTQPQPSWPDKNWLAQPSLPVPEVVIPPKSVPSGKPLPSTPCHLPRFFPLSLNLDTRHQSNPPWILWPFVTHCLGVFPDPGFGFGVGVLESGVGWDGASASGSLCRLDFCIRYLAIGRGRVMGCDGEAVDSNGGDAHK